MFQTSKIKTLYKIPFRRWLNGTLIFQVKNRYFLTGKCVLFKFAKFRIIREKISMRNTDTQEFPDLEISGSVQTLLKVIQNRINYALYG